MKIHQHVVQRKNGWAVLGEGNQRDTVVLSTQREAVTRARKIARNQGSELIVHSNNCHVGDRDKRVVNIRARVAAR